MLLISLAVGITLRLFTALVRKAYVERNAGWGREGWFWLFAVLLLVCLLVGRYAYRRWAPERVRAWLSGAGTSIQKRVNRVCTYPTLTAVLAVLLVAGFSAYAAWFASAGKFPEFYSIDNYYIRQGTAFLHGQLSLLEQPNPRLLALQNPYDFQQRETVPYLWDSTYYQGHYYIYWGPVPALIYAALEGLSGVPPAAQPAGIVLLIGLNLIALALLIQIRRWFFPRAPALTLVLFLLAAMVNLPAMFMLARLLVYEMAILTGQFFLFLGLLLWMMYLKTSRIAWVALAGLSWGFAVGSRTDLAISVLVYVGFVFFYFWHTACKPRAAHLPWRKLAALFTPLAVCALALAWYNWARFGSPIETGVGYQLTMDITPRQFFSIRYFLPNLYTWLFYSPSLASTFPINSASEVTNQVVPAWAAFQFPQQFDHNFLGLLPTVPVLGLLIFTLPVFARQVARARSASQSDSAVRWEFLAMIGLSGLIQFGMLLLFYYGAGRYATNFYLSFLLLSAFTAWGLGDRLHSKPRLRAVFWGGITLLIVWGAVVGMMGGFVIQPVFFYKYNAAFFASLSTFFTNLTLGIH